MHKSSPKFVLTFFISCAITFLIANFLLLQLVVQLARNGYVQEDVFGKAFILRHLKNRPEFVFVGSSRTLNQIDTQYLSTQGINSYNFGVVGARLGALHYQVSLGQKFATKSTIISLPVEDLYSTPQCPRHPVWIDVVSKQFQLGLCSLENAFAGIDKYLPILVLMNLESSLFSIGGEEEIETDTKSKIQKTFNFDFKNSTRKLAYTRGNLKRLVTVFQNGDGAIFSQAGRKNPSFISDRTHSQFNPTAIVVMQELCHKSHTIFVIEPSIDNMTIINPRLDELVGCEVISNAAMKFADDDIADGMHLNFKGQQKYTQRLQKQLAELFKK